MIKAGGTAGKTANPLAAKVLVFTYIGGRDRMSGRQFSVLLSDMPKRISKDEDILEHHGHIEPVEGMGT